MEYYILVNPASSLSADGKWVGTYNWQLLMHRIYKLLDSRSAKSGLSQDIPCIPIIAMLRKKTAANNKLMHYMH